MRRAARGSDLQRHSSLFVLRMDTNGVPYVGMVPMHLRVAIFLRDALGTRRRRRCDDVVLVGVFLPRGRSRGLRLPNY